MKRLGLKHLAPYLPYSLTMADLRSYHKSKKDEVLTTDNLHSILYKQHRKPNLRPFTDLVKEVEINGGRFTPAIELVMLSIHRGIKEDIAPSIDFDYGIVNKPFGKLLKVTKIDQWYLMLSFDEPDRIPYFQLQKLFEWHFDVFGLIPEGLAIDINTLEL